MQTEAEKSGHVNGINRIKKVPSFPHRVIQKHPANHDNRWSMFIFNMRACNTNNLLCCVVCTYYVHKANDPYFTLPADKRAKYTANTDHFLDNRDATSLAE